MKNVSNSFLLLSGLMFYGLSQAAVAEEESQETRDNEESLIEDVLVIGDEKTEITEVRPDTQELLGVAGAANDPLQAIYSLPGVTFSNGDGPGGSDPVIRGSAPQDNAYFIDWVPAGYIFHLFGNSIFNRNLIHSFDLYPAAFSSQYGNATGGIIDVRLREPRNQDFTTTLHTSFIDAGVMFESGISDNQAFYASFRRSTLDLIVSEDDVGDDDEGFQIDELPISSDYQVKYDWSINDYHKSTLR